MGYILIQINTLTVLFLYAWGNENVYLSKALRYCCPSQRPNTTTYTNLFMCSGNQEIVDCSLPLDGETHRESDAYTRAHRPMSKHVGKDTIH